VQCGDDDGRRRVGDGDNDKGRRSQGNLHNRVPSMDWESWHRTNGKARRTPTHPLASIDETVG